MKNTLSKNIIILTNIFCLILFSNNLLLAQAGAIDPTYGNNGIFTGINYGNCYAAVLQHDDKLIMAGEGEGNGFWGFSIARLTTDGQPDESFGTGGRVVTDFGFEVQVPFAAAMQADGKIVVAGVNYEDENTRNNFLVARYLTDGKLDSSFAGKGWTSTNFNGDDYARAITILPDGKILVGGSNTYRALIAKYNTDGSLDYSFGEAGLVITKIYNFPVINAMAVQADGKILLAGTVSQNQNGSVALCRYHADGSPDNSFGTKGILISDWAQGYGEICNDMILQADGKILLAGSVVVNGVTYAKQAIVRYNIDGNLDNTFNENGVSLYTIEDHTLRPESIKIQPDGKILTGGLHEIRDYSSDPPIANYYVTRILIDGSTDYSFGQNGIVSIDPGEIDWAYDMLLTSSNKILLSGTSEKITLPHSNNYAAIALNGGEGSLPITYKNFTATQKNGFIQLNWQTSSEINNGYFTVERSNTGSAFIEIARVKSNGSGNSAASYIYADKLAQDGNNYYRLKQVDTDGKSSYSKTISISFVKNGNIKIQPNPVKDKLTVSGLATGENNTLMITDIEGTILKKINTATSQQEINVQQLLPGSYILSVKNNKGNFVAKFLKH